MFCISVEIDGPINANDSIKYQVARYFSMLLNNNVPVGIHYSNCTGLQTSSLYSMITCTEKVVIHPVTCDGVLC